MNSKSAQYANALISERSPYLLQHAHNPVNWYPWNSQTLEKAKTENKLLLISIGYSACHWCHVMAHECFEDEETAILMNTWFINIKVDREERPDVDAVYMQAVQLMTGRGGWPLNCIALPDGRPIFGGTYFPKAQWQDIIKNVGHFFAKDKNKCLEYADEIMSAIAKPEIKLHKEDHEILTRSLADQVYANWKQHFDYIEGGPNRVPKFPLPNNFEFLLRYAYHTDNQECLDYVLLSLDKMALGGINDQLGGGFARYSTDGFWKVPHFEKMLYDNAQLVSVYSLAWQISKKELYREVVNDTLNYIEREMTSPEGSFYSALDADSEGEEGKYYVWKKEELEVLDHTSRVLFEKYFNVNEKGYWEHKNYILLRTISDEEFAEKNNLTIASLKAIIENCKKILFQERSKRERPGLDDKVLVSWNSLMLKGYVDAYKAFKEQKFLDAAVKNADFILKNCETPDGGLYHTCKNNEPAINGYLEDYCFTIEAFLALFEIKHDVLYLEKSKQFLDYCFSNFQDTSDALFYFTSSKDEPLIIRQKEKEDNVIPASNSSLAKVLFMMGKYYPGSGYDSKVKDMLSHVSKNMIRFGSSYSNWGILLLNLVYPYYEIVLTGDQSEEMAVEINKNFMPNKILFAAKVSHDFQLLKDRFIENQTMAYLCENKTCRLPVRSVSEIISSFQKN